MKLLILALSLFLLSCSGIRYEYKNSESGSIEMTTYKTNPLFYDDEEKVKIVISKELGGQIEKISWLGRELIAAPVKENFPNKEESFKDLKPYIIDDGMGLIDLSITKRGEYRFRRSYNISHNDLLDEYQIEVIYNVMNLSRTKKLHQQWTQELLFTGHKEIVKDANTVSTGHAIALTYGEKKLNLKVAQVNVFKPMVEIKGSNVKMGSSQDKLIESREKLKWKVIYTLKQN
jgi:hypothetical protein